MKTLRPHQKKALEYALPRARVAFFMEMRLGKTLVAIRWVKQTKCKNILVLAPKSALPGWIEELKDDGVLPIRIIELNGNTQDRYNQALSLVGFKKTTSRWFLTNYESMTANPNMHKVPWDCIILDESTKIRNVSSEISKAMVKYTTAQYRAILTGCPCPEGEIDYFQQMKFLFDGFMGENDIWFWKKKFCIKDGFDWRFNPCFKTRLKENIEDKVFTLTRKEAGLGELKVYEKRYVEMNYLQKSRYKEIEKDFASLTYNKSTKWAPVKFEWMHQIAGGLIKIGNEVNLVAREKIDEIIYLLKNDLKNEKVVIWFKHNWELNMVCAELNKVRIQSAIYTGEVKGMEDEFKNGRINVMLAQPKAASQGLDWSCASTAIYYSNWCDGEIRIQSEDRIVSTSKKDPLLYIDLITKDTIDEDIYELVTNKKLKATDLMKKLTERMKKKYGSN